MEKSNLEKLLTKATSLIEEGSSNDTPLERLEDIRVQLAAIRFYLSENHVKRLSEIRDLAEVEMDHEESNQFGRLFNLYIDKYQTKEGKKRYTKSSCESLARKTYKLKDNPFSKRKKEYLSAKRDVDNIYQVIKSIDNFSHAISSKLK